MRYLLLLLSILAISCKKEAQLEYGLKVSETLRVFHQSEPPTLDWNLNNEGHTNATIVNIMTGLAELDTRFANLQAKESLAESWTSKDNKTWVFQLRKDVKWTDGQGFQAQQILDSWERLLNPKSAASYAGILFPIKNAQAYNEGKISDFSKVGIRKDNDYQITVELDYPVAYFPSLTAIPPCFPIRKDLIEKFGDQWTSAQNMVSLGAYKLKTWEHDKAIVLERNPTYFGTPAKIPYVLSYMIAELSTALNLFESGKLDAIDELAKSDVKAYADHPSHRSIPVLSFQYYAFNTKKPPFNNLEVRKAFVQSINQDDMVQLGASQDIATRSLIPENMLGHNKELGLKTDIAAAKALLAKHYPDLSKFPKASLAINSHDNIRKIAEIIQSQWQQNLNYNMEIESMEWKILIDTLRSNTPSIYRAGWVADYPDPDSFMSLFTSESKNHHTGWKNANYDKLVIQARSETDTQKRIALYNEAQKILLDDAVILPLFFVSNHKLISNRVKNYPLNSMRTLDFKYAEF